MPVTVLLVRGSASEVMTLVSTYVRYMFRAGSSDLELTAALVVVVVVASNNQHAKESLRHLKQLVAFIEETRIVVFAYTLDFGIRVIRVKGPLLLPPLSRFPKDETRGTRSQPIDIVFVALFEPNDDDDDDYDEDFVSFDNSNKIIVMTVEERRMTIIFDMKSYKIYIKLIFNVTYNYE
ncbi:hypothetical protein M0802_007710 [Mischocyttarus mexicanus]|nr:hypothetical protein M0802_007710 [Mischocyttarus mexicanus]